MREHIQAHIHKHIQSHVLEITYTPMRAHYIHTHIHPITCIRDYIHTYEHMNERAYIHIHTPNTHIYDNTLELLASINTHLVTYSWMSTRMYTLANTLNTCTRTRCKNANAQHHTHMNHLCVMQYKYTQNTHITLEARSTQMLSLQRHKKNRGRYNDTCSFRAYDEDMPVWWGWVSWHQRFTVWNPLI